MEQRFGTNRIDVEVLRDFCEREGQCVVYRKGEQMEREGDPSRWFGFVAEGCFKYVTHGISERLRVGASAGIDREHITWFSFEGEFAGDYPACLDGGPALTTIEAMVPTRIIRVSGEQLVDFSHPQYNASLDKLNSILHRNSVNILPKCSFFEIFFVPLQPKFHLNTYLLWPDRLKKHPSSTVRTHDASRHA